MTETARALNAEEVIELIRCHIATCLDGGPNRKAEDIELARQAGLKTEMVSALWDDAENQVRVVLPPLEVVVLPPQEDKAAEVVKEASADSSTSWKRRWGEESWIGDCKWRGGGYGPYIFF
jgi:hypothetical protein